MIFLEQPPTDRGVDESNIHLAAKPGFLGTQSVSALAKG